MEVSIKDILDRKTNKYEVVYADPPWSYNDKMHTHSFSLEHEYKTQDIQWIKSLHVKMITAHDSCLFLWAVSPQIPEALEVMAAWGFAYKTIAFCWSKITPYGNLVSNLGRWSMGNVELCLLGVKGKPTRASKM